MKRPTKGNPGRRDGKSRPPLADYVAPSQHGFDQDYDENDGNGGGPNRAWKRNMRCPEPLTPENSWLATQPEFQRHWGEGEDPDEFHYSEPPQVYDDQYGHPPEPEEPQVTKPRRKPADISTLMARYTAKTEEEAKRRLPPPRPLPQAPQPRQQRPQRQQSRTPQPVAAKRTTPASAPPQATAKNPVARRAQSAPAKTKLPAKDLGAEASSGTARDKRQPKPDMGVSALPAELPQGEPAPLPTKSRSTMSQSLRPQTAAAETNNETKLAAGSIIVTDGQVRLVEASDEPATNSPTPKPQSSSKSGRPNLRSLSDISQNTAKILDDPALSPQANDNSLDAEIQDEIEAENTANGDTAADGQELGEDGSPVQYADEDGYYEEDYDEEGYAEGEYAEEGYDEDQYGDDYELVDAQQQSLVPFSEQASMPNPAYADVANSEFAYGDDEYAEAEGYEEYQDDPNVWQSQGYITQGYDSNRDGSLPSEKFQNANPKQSRRGSQLSPQQLAGEPYFGPSSGQKRDWGSANHQSGMASDWHQGGGQDRPSRSWSKIFVVILLLGAAGYGSWVYGPEKLITMATDFVSQQVETATQFVKNATTTTSNNDPAALPGDTPGANLPDEVASRLAPGTESSAVSSANTIDLNSSSRLPPDANLQTRQFDDPNGQKTTLWWKAKTVAQFPALTEAELAGQPQLTTPTGEAVMAPSGPLETANQAPASAPSLPQANGEVAKIVQQIANYQISDAAKAADKLISANSSAPNPLILKGHTDLLMAQNFEALTNFDKALNIEPQNELALLGRGKALVNLGRAIEAQNIAAGMLSTSPNLKGALWLSAEALASTGKLEGAMQICDRFGANGASISEAEWCRGVANKRARRPLQTEANFSSALQAASAEFISKYQRYFRFKGYYDGEISGVVDSALMQASTRCAATRDCNTAGI